VQSQIRSLKEQQLREYLPDSGSYSCELASLQAHYMSRMALEILFKEREVEKAQEKVEQAVREYTQARADQRALETLRERKLQEYTAAAEKFDLAVLDEMATQRYALKNFSR
jgi:flagellar export protein FliJ